METEHDPIVYENHLNEGTDKRAAHDDRVHEYMEFGVLEAVVAQIGEAA